MMEVMRNHALTEEELRELREAGSAGDASADYVVGMGHYWGVGGLPEDYARAAEVVWRAAGRGHRLATVLKGVMLYNGSAVPIDKTEAFRCFLEAALGGCPLAMRYTAECYRDADGTARDLFQAVRWLARAAAACEELSPGMLEELRRRYPPSSYAPFGQWKPDAEHFALTPPAVRLGLRAWLMVARRMQLPRDLARLICGYIVSRSGWSVDPPEDAEETVKPSLQ